LFLLVHLQVALPGCLPPSTCKPAWHTLRCILSALQARQRLAFRLQEKDKQLAKLRGVIRELESKLIEAHKRQADL